MTGVWILVRLALKRDRVMIPAWVLGLGAAVAVTASSYSSLYATEASRREVVQTLGTTPATLALYGRIYADSVGGLVAWRLGGIALALAGLMSILLVVRHTRAEEETGRAELIGAGVVGRHAPLAAALITAALAGLALGVIVTLAIVATGLAFAGALALGAAFAAVGARVRRHRRRGGADRRVRARRQRARGRRCSAAAFALRAIGDAGPHWVAWLSPLGWGQALRAFADERWWLLVPLLALAALLTVAAVRLAARRDLGAGILPPRPGPARGALRTPLQLAWRLQRGALAGWAAGFAILGAAFGSIAQDIGDVIGDSPEVLDALKRLGGAQSLADAYLAATLRRAGADRRGLRRPGRAAPARRGDRRPRRAAAGDRRSRARAGRSATRRSRSRAPRCCWPPPASPPGSRTRAQTGDAGQLPRLLGAALAQVPAAWVLAGVTLALFGLAPRADGRELGRARRLPRAGRARPGRSSSRRP